VTRRTVSAGSANLPLLLVVGITAAMLAVRLAEAHGDPLMWLRATFSLGALAFVVFARRHSLVRRALFAFALEAVGGILTFVYVDVPFVHAHQAQIGSLAVAVDGIVENNAATQR